VTFEQWWDQHKDDLFAAALGARTHSDTIDEAGEQMLRNETARAWNAALDEVDRQCANVNIGSVMSIPDGILCLSKDKVARLRAPVTP
jgi:hypothetical protein